MVAIASRSPRCCFSRSFQLHTKPPSPPRRPPPLLPDLRVFSTPTSLGGLPLRLHSVPRSPAPRISTRSSPASLHGSSTRAPLASPARAGAFRRGYSRHYLLEDAGPQRRKREDFKAIVVFWDLTSCAAPQGIDPHRISPNITVSLRKNGFLGPLSIHAYGNTRSLSDQDFLQALVATGIDLHHIPGGMKNSITYFLVDLLLWVKDNLPPARVLLISGDKNFSTVMHKLQMRGYDILWAHPDAEVSSDVLSLVNEVWAWDSIIRGAGLGRKPSTSNMPANKRDASEFDNKRGETLQTHCEEDNKRETFGFDAKSKPQVVPKVVHDKVMDIIRLRPAGYTLAAFRRQLVRSNVVLDKDFYGYKDLLSFLLSIRELKANLVWTSDRTRAYMFTEDSGESISTKADSVTTPQEERKESKSSKPLLKQTGDAIGGKKNIEEVNVSKQEALSLRSTEEHEKLLAAAVNKTKFARIWEAGILGMAKRLLGFSKSKENLEFQEKLKPDKDSERNCRKNDTEQCSTEGSKIVEVKEAGKRHTSEKNLSSKLVEGNKDLLKNTGCGKLLNESDIILKEINQNKKLSKVLKHSSSEKYQLPIPPNEAMTSKSSENMEHAFLESGKELPDKLISNNNRENDSEQCSAERSKLTEVMEAGKNQTAVKSHSLEVDDVNKCLQENIKDESLLDESGVIPREVNQGNKLSKVLNRSNTERHEGHSLPTELVTPKASENMDYALLVSEKELLHVVISKHEGMKDNEQCSAESSKFIEVYETGESQICDKSISLKMDEGNKGVRENIKEEKLFDESVVILTEVNQTDKLSKVLNHSNAERCQGHGLACEPIASQSSENMKHGLLESGRKFLEKLITKNVGGNNSAQCSGEISNVVEVKKAGKNQTSDKSLPLKVDEGNKENIKDKKFSDESDVIPKEVNQNNKLSKVLNHSNTEMCKGHSLPGEAMTSKSSEILKYGSLGSGKGLPSKKDLENIGFTEEIWKMSVMYLASEEGRHQFTKENSMDSLVKLLLKSNLSEVTKYQEHELRRLAKLLYSCLYPRNQNADTSDLNSPLDKAIEKHEKASKTKATNKKSSVESPHSNAKMDMAISTLDASILSLVESVVLKDLREMLISHLKGCKDGVQLGRVKPEFKKKFGYDLNNKVLGYSSLSSLIKSLDGVVMSNGNSPVITMSRTELKKQKNEMQT